VKDDRTDLKSARARALRRYVGAALVIGVVIAVATALMWQTPAPQRPGPGGRFRAGAEEAVPTRAASAQRADVPVYLEGVGTTRALNMVTVRAQVDGKLVSVNFKEGQDVERGFVLAQIDPTLYRAQYDQAMAKKAQDEALLANVRRDLERYTRLVATNAMAAQQADTQRALVAQYEAQVMADQAAIDNAKAVLDYSTITAPIAGRTGLRLVDAGNVVRASDATGIVVITQLRPISILFTLPQQQLGLVNAAFAKGPLAVDAVAADNKTLVDRGTLLVVDNQVDQATGTVKLRAEFPNADLQLWPGQFVSVRLLVDTLRNVVVVPTAAVQRGPSGLFVFVVRENDTVAVRPVTVSQQDENQTVIASGLEPGERVATTGFHQLTDGRRVSIGGADGPPATGPPRGRRNEGTVQSDPPRIQRRSESPDLRTSRTP